MARYWVVSWHYREPYRQKVVPYPSVHLTFSGGRATVHGVASGYRIRVLEGDGSVFGVEFRPGCFRPLLGAPVSTPADRSVDAREVFGPDLPARPERSADIVAAIAAAPGLTRVDAVAAGAGTSVRQLQRLLAEYVGIGPKWVIRRYRLHEVTERLAAGAEVDRAALAAELGYADHAHVVRDFRDMRGETPTW